MPKAANRKEYFVPRPPVVVIMGHVDHGKSKLLDHIRKSNIVEGEAGGITQHIGAYEVEHQSEGKMRRITFIDTPGHEAFSKMRDRGAQVADIAILVVSATEGVKAQTKEALLATQAAKIPYIIAINKIDLPDSSPDRVKQELAEDGVYVEGYGGEIPFALISAKDGTGISDLLDVILLIADMAELKGDPNIAATGIVIESHVDPKRGATATIIIKNGTIEKPSALRAGDAIAPVRTMKDDRGKDLQEASFSKPVQIVGWDKAPSVGSTFTTYKTKKEAERADVLTSSSLNLRVPKDSGSEIIPILPVVVKADVAGSLEAVVQKLESYSTDKLLVRVVGSGVGPIGENDVRSVIGSESVPVILGFGVTVDRVAVQLAESNSINIHTSDIIYKLTEYFEKLFLERTPRHMIEHVVGKFRVLRTFSAQRTKQVIGGSVFEGAIKEGCRVHVVRNDSILGQGKIVELQLQKIAVKEVAAGNQCGMQVDSKIELAERDMLEQIELVEE